MASLADVPTADEVGMPSLHMSTWFGLLGAARHAQAGARDAEQVVARGRGRQGSSRAAREDRDRSLFLVDKATLEAHRAMLAAQIAPWGPIIDKAGIQAE